MDVKPQVLVLGGAVTALESALLLRMRLHGKKMLGVSVPMRLSAGDPFHAGKAWQAMDVGIKAMSGMLAE
jgi:hypothetical protein